MDIKPLTSNIKHSDFIFAYLVYFLLSVFKYEGY